MPYFVFASGLLDNLNKVGQGAGYNPETNETSVATIAGTVVAAILSLLGIIFVVLIIFAGITWMTAGGDEAKIEKAQAIMRNAIIGLIVTVGVYAIYQVINLFIFQTLK